MTGRRPDGYHELDSLIAFANIGDRLLAAPAAGLSLELCGPEAAGLAGVGEDNLVLRAARRLAAAAGVTAGAALRLEKNLPVASGIGGGSSDAAAALLLLSRLWGLDLDQGTLAEIGLALGADLPVCLCRRPAWVSGVGERVDPLPGLPAAGILLANPRVALPTAAVFAARGGPFGAGVRFAPMPADAEGLAAALAACRNDLAEAALSLVPQIATVLRRLVALPGALLARMSGSGATCFALFRDGEAAARACAILAAAEPRWWVAAGRLAADRFEDALDPRRG